MGSTWQSFHFNTWLVNQNWVFKNTGEDPPFSKSRKPLLSGWVGGLVGRLVGGDQTTPSIFPISGHLNKHDVLIPNMASKIVYTNNIKSYEHFKFQNSKILDDHL